MLRFTTSAESRLAAISKVVRVRVLGSKNRLKIDLPRSKGTFFTSRSVTPTKDSAVSRMLSRIGAGSPSVVRRCCSCPLVLSWGLLLIVPILAVEAKAQRSTWGFFQSQHFV